MFRRLRQLLGGAATPGAGDAGVRRYRGGPVAYNGLRAMALSVTAERLGPSAEGAGVLAVLADLAVADRHATLMCCVDGSVSLYTPKGGGVIGAGHKSEAVREAASRAIIEVAARLAPTLPAVESDPGLPESGLSRFTLVTNEGLRSATGPMSEIVAGRHALSGLFAEVNRVITFVRRATPEQFGGGLRPGEPVHHP